MASCTFYILQLTTMSWMLDAAPIFLAPRHFHSSADDNVPKPHVVL